MFWIVSFFFDPNIEGYIGSDRNINGNPLIWAVVNNGGCCVDWWVNASKRDSFSLDARYDGNFKEIKIDANYANSLYGNSSTLQPNSIRITYLIRYSK